LNIQHRYVSEWHLIIDNVVTDDEGEYICKTNGNFFKIINLQVQMPPQIDDLQSTPAGTITLKEESSITLRCLADGKPEPTVKWYRWKKYKHLMSEKEELINQIGNEITITSIKRNDPNVYECIAKNSVPPATSRIFTIEIHYLPDVDVEIRKAFQFLHKKFSIECKITSNPLEKLFWLKNGQQLLMNNNNEDNSKNVLVEKYDVSNINELHKTLLTLTVQNAQKDDFGEYECCAVNAYGQICSNVIVQEIKSDRKHHVQTTMPTTTIFSASPPPSTISIKNNDFILLNTKQENLIIDDLTDSELDNDTSLSLLSSSSSSLSDNSLDSKDKRRHYLIKTKYLESQSANTAATSLTADSSLSSSSSSSELIAKSNLFLYLLFIIILSLFIIPL
jgi:hypothetical protein